MKIREKLSLHARDLYHSIREYMQHMNAPCDIPLDVMIYDCYEL